MDIRPQDLPEIRAELARLRTGIGFDGIVQFQSDSTISDRLGIDRVALIELETLNVQEAELFHVSRDMTDLATTAALSLPSFAMDAQDFPAEQGLICFNGGIAVRWGAHPVTVCVVSWRVLAGFGAIIAYYTDVGSFRAAMPYQEPIDAILRSQGVASDGVWPTDIVRTVAAFISEHDERYGETEGVAQDGVAAKAWPAVRAALLLMQQPLAVVSEVEPDRAARKRLRRIGRERDSVRVIELRRPKTAAGVSSDSSREYHHRWITRGHWRQQWFPKREVHRPVWIAPHLKGPEGAPLIGGEKVYAWKR
ncbi:hypothetical protein [Streptomyces bottropensis]|uniref:hypothetical protein n=1 Tax=Streptomyces bottropensis TaxID=42235 RepID=UPI0036968FF1